MKAMHHLFGHDIDPAICHLKSVIAQVHLEMASQLGYIAVEDFHSIDDAYEKTCAQIVRMIDQPEKWLIRRKVEP